MVFKCPEGHSINTTWKKLRDHIECPICTKIGFKDYGDKIVAKPRGVKRILALDQATRVSGYSIYEDGKLLKYGSFKADGYDALDRDANIRNWVVSMIKAWQIDFVGLEGIQMQDNIGGGYAMGVTTFEALARLQGILLISLYDLKIDYEVVHTSVWRQHCGVKGKTRAEKKQSIRKLVKEWYDITATEDEADAIGIGKYFAENGTKKKKEFQTMNWE